MLSFGGAQFASGIYMAFVSYYLMMFCTDVALIPPAATAILLLCYRLFSVVNGQVTALLINRSNFKQGKYRPYFKWFSLPFAISLAALGLTPVINITGRIIYATITLILCELCWLALHTASLSMLPYLSLDDVNRTKFVSFSNSSAILAFILVGTFMLPLASFFGGGDRNKGFPLTLALFAIIIPPLYLNAYFRLKERHYSESPGKPFIKDMFLAVGRNKRLLLFLAGYCLYYMADTFKNLTTYYYMTYNMGRADLIPVIILAGLISPLAVQPIIPRLLSLAKKETLIIFGLFASSCASLLMLAAGNNPYALISCAVLYGMFTAIVANLVFAVMASFSDELRIRQNISMSEILAAAMDLSATVGAAITSSTVPMVMAAFGYIANSASQTAGTLTGIRALYIPCTAAGMILSGLVLLPGLSKKRS